uniref:Uncharacterized protein n=1 Tax=Leptobrachium leishanense TaxID=445787 RepID=A0A8C5LQ01_9ANUR
HFFLFIFLTLVLSVSFLLLCFSRCITGKTLKLSEDVADVLASLPNPSLTRFGVMQRSIGKDQDRWRQICRTSSRQAVGQGITIQL